MFTTSHKVKVMSLGKSNLKENFLPFKSNISKSFKRYFNYFSDSFFNYGHISNVKNRTQNIYSLTN